MIPYDSWLPTCILKKLKDILSLKYYKKILKSTRKKRVLYLTIEKRIDDKKINASEIASAIAVAMAVFLAYTIISVSPYREEYGGMIDFFTLIRYSKIVIPALIFMIQIIAVVSLVVLFLCSKEKKTYSLKQKVVFYGGIGVGIIVWLVIIHSPTLNKYEYTFYVTAFVFSLFCLLIALYKKFTILGFLVAMCSLLYLGNIIISNLYYMVSSKQTHDYTYSINGIAKSEEIEYVTRLGDMLLVKIKNKEKEIVLPISAFISARPAEQNTKKDAQVDNASAIQGETAK